MVKIHPSDGRSGTIVVNVEVDEHTDIVQHLKNTEGGLNIMCKVVQEIVDAEVAVNLPANMLNNLQ